MSFQAYLENLTPFAAATFPMADPHGQEVLLLVVSSTFDRDERTGSLRLAPVQGGPCVADEFYGDPARGSVRHESDLALYKPRTDLLVNACAYAPRGRAVESVRVAVQVADIRKELIVSGDRSWRSGSPSRPQRFMRMPVRFERAFGGIDSRAADPAGHRAEPRNLSGVGFRGVVSHDPAVRTEVPNVEYPGAGQASPHDTPVPAGLSAVARGWQPRLRWAGTFDAEWLARQWPLLPLDFDPRHNQAAPPDQQSKILRGGESVALINLTPEGSWRFALPHLDLPVTLLRDQSVGQLRATPDTVLIEPDEGRVTMTSRLAIALVPNGDTLREVVLGHTSPGWSHARRLRKRYLGHGGPGRLHYRL